MKKNVIAEQGNGQSNRQDSIGQDDALFDSDQRGKVINVIVKKEKLEATYGQPF